MRNALLLAVSCTVISTQATIWDLDFGPAVGGFGLNGQNERPLPGTPSSATGSEIPDYQAPNGGMQYNDATKQLALHFAWGSISEVEDAVGTAGTPLSSAFAAMHIHGPADQNNPAGVLYNLVTMPSERAGDELLLSNGDQNGLFDVVFTLVDNPNGTTFTVAQQEAQLLSGLWYVNIHSANYPAGEIRGQLTAIPEPHHYAAITGLGLLGFAGYRRFKLARA